MHTTIVVYVCSMDIQDDDTTEVLSYAYYTHVLRKYIMHNMHTPRVVFVSIHVYEYKNYKIIECIILLVL